MSSMGNLLAILMLSLLVESSNPLAGVWTNQVQSPDGSCWVMLYKSDHAIGWSEASGLAVDAGGALATSKTSSMTAFLHQVASNAALQACDGPWLGAQRNATAVSVPLTDNWQWVDGTAMNFSAWTDGQPNGSQWLTWSLRIDSDPDVLSTWAASWASPEGGVPVFSLIASFQTPPDCNGNGQPDDLDIAQWPELDIDLDGFIDTCCPGDLTGDGDVSIDDVLHVLSSYSGLGADLDGDGLTDVDDLLIVLNNYGCTR
tara:strand:+ start:933 stop:1706 length:774 start_codon:yes stop_codon:yes gene_type:complete